MAGQSKAAAAAAAAGEELERFVTHLSDRALLNLPNIHKTGHTPGVLPAHIGMRVRFTLKLNGKLGLVQYQKATIVDFLA